MNKKWEGEDLVDPQKVPMPLEALEEIIKYYKDQGYVFLGLDTSSYPAHHTVQN